jgi:hypothetical protein
VRWIVSLVILAALGAGAAWVGVWNWGYVSRESATANATVVRAGHCTNGHDHHGTGVVTIGGVRRTVSVDCIYKLGGTDVIHYDPADPTNYRDTFPRRAGLVHGETYFTFAVAAACLAGLTLRIRHRVRLLRSAKATRSARGDRG